MLKRLIIQWWPTAVVLAGILWLTLAPKPVPDGTPSLFEGADKIVHGGMMYALTLTAWLDWRRSQKMQKKKRTRKQGMIALGIIGICVVAFSALDELAQGLMGMGRSEDVFDLVADICGIIAALLTVCIFRNLQLPSCRGE